MSQSTPMGVWVRQDPLLSWPATSWPGWAECTSTSSGANSWALARCTAEHLLAVTSPMFDGLYEYRRRAVLLGTEPT